MVLAGVDTMEMLDDEWVGLVISELVLDRDV
jgi:hypothetical protein